MRAPGVVAHVGKLATPALLMLKFPPPVDVAIGIEAQPETPVSAMSALPSPLKSPATIETPVEWAQVPKFGTPALVMPKLPSPLDVATGIEAQPTPPVSA